FDRGAFLEKLGVGAYGTRGARIVGDFAAYPLRGADGNRALGDDQLGAVHVPPDGARHLEHVLQVGRAVLARWRADRDEDDVRTLDRSADVGGELQAAVPLI